MEGEGEGELGLGELGGLGMGTGASIGDVADGGAMAATGETSVGGIGADPSSGSGSASAIAGGDAISGNASFGGQLADQNVGNGVLGGGTNTTGSSASFDLNPSGTPASNAALMNEIQNNVAVTQSGPSALAALATAALTNDDSSSGAALQKGDALGAVGPNFAGTGFGPDAGFGVASFANIADQGSTAGVPAETQGSHANPGMSQANLADFGQFTSDAPGVTAANNGVYTSDMLAAFAERASGASPDPATGVSTVNADQQAASPGVVMAGSPNLAGVGTGASTVAGGNAAQDETSAPSGGRNTSVSIEQAVQDAPPGGTVPNFGLSGPAEHFGGGVSSFTGDGVPAATGDTGSTNSAALNGFGDFGSGLSGEGGGQGQNAALAFDMSQAASNSPAAAAVLTSVFGSGLWPQFSTDKKVNPYWKFSF
jgi:hypothetical protein